MGQLLYRKLLVVLPLDVDSMVENRYIIMCSSDVIIKNSQKPNAN